MKMGHVTGTEERNKGSQDWYRATQEEWLKKIEADLGSSQSRRKAK